jgi:hypothetical protein
MISISKADKQAIKKGVLQKLILAAGGYSDQLFFKKSLSNL